VQGAQADGESWLGRAQAPVELAGHLGLLGPDDGPQLCEFGPQPGFGLVTLRDPRAQVEQAPVGLGPLPHFAAEDHRSGGPAADHRGVGPSTAILQGGHARPGPDS
jgi:hypothetical protein